MTTTATIPVIDESTERGLLIAAAPSAGVPVLDRVAMRLGLALLIWGRQHASAAIAGRPERPRLVDDARWGDARWFMR